METLGDRVAFLIKTLGITKSKFAEQINVSQPFISVVCSGSKIPSDRTISDICRVFSVSEAWLRDGIGEMFVSRTMNQELAMMANSLMSESDDSFRKRFIAALLEIPPELWPHVEQFMSKLAAPDQAQKED